MSTIRDLLSVILEEEVKHQQTLAALRDLQKKYDALKAEADKRNRRKKSDVPPQP